MAPYLEMQLLAFGLTVVATSAVVSPGTTTSFRMAGSTDVILSGGASLQAAPVPALRSGTPGQHSLAQFASALTPGVTVTAISFEYSYSRGYKGPHCSNFSVWVAGTPVYFSPVLSDYPYSKSKPNYSSPIAFSSKPGLSVKVPAADVSRLELAFDDNDCNIQLRTPLVVNLTCAGGPCTAFPLLPQFFDSNMVLQRDQAAAIYGHTGVPGNTVTVELQPQRRQPPGQPHVQPAGAESTHLQPAVSSWSGTVEPNGSWVVKLAPQKASTGWTVTVSTGTGTAKRTRVLKNVAFGDVYLCSGQSNMEVRVADSFNATAEIAAAGDYPGIRMWTAANVIAESRTDDIVDIQKGQPDADIGPYASSSWATSTPAAFPKKSQSLVFGTQDYFSAACFFFGRDVYISQGGAVPIGLMASDWGGQPIEPFMSPDALADKTCGGTRNTTAEADVAPPIADQQPEGLGATSAASVLWWGMVEPLAQMRMTGAVWYQGETNYNYALQYSCSFPSMIADWRRKFNLPNLLFLFVQLAPSTQLGNFVDLRAAQMTALDLPQVGYAVAVDIGDLESPMGSIHPRRKQEVGRRLSLEARRMQYGEPTLVSTGPVMAAVMLGAGNTTVEVTYVAGTAVGLHVAPTADCDEIGSKLCCGESPFMVGTKGGMVRGNYTIKGNTVVLGPFNPGQLLSPPRVSYAWEQWPQCSVYNGKGGCDDHEGIAGTPWCQGGKGAGCPVF